MRHRLLLSVLIGLNLAAHLSGSAAATRASDAQGILGGLSLQNLDQGKIDTMLRGATQGTVEDYAKTTFGYSRDDLERLDAGYLVLPKNEEYRDLSPMELEARVQAARDELTLEEQRAQDAVQISVEAIAAQQYLDGLHESLEGSYDQAVELSVKNVEDQIKQIMQYFQKFPSIATACT